MKSNMGPNITRLLSNPLDTLLFLFPPKIPQDSTNTRQPQETTFLTKRQTKELFNHNTNVPLMGEHKTKPLEEQMSNREGELAYPKDVI